MYDLVIFLHKNALPVKKSKTKITNNGSNSSSKKKWSIVGSIVVDLN